MAPVPVPAASASVRGRRRVLDAALIGTLCLAAVLRLLLLGKPSVWFDEAWVVRMAEHGWGQMFSVLLANDAHPPLYYVLMKAWMAVAGSGEAALRLPSAAASIASVVLTYALMRRLVDRRVAVVSAFLLGVSPLAITVAQQARMYALLEMLAVASTLALLSGVDRGGIRRWAVYAAVMTLLLYVHYFGFIVLAAHGIWVAAFARGRSRAWSAALAVVALAYAPWASALWHQLVHANGWPWYRNPASAYVEVTDLFGLLAFGGSLFGVGGYFTPGTPRPLVQWTAFLPFLAVILCGVAALAANRRALAAVALPPALGLTIIAGLSLAHMVLYPRWFSFVEPFYAAILAQGAVAAADRWAAPVRRWGIPVVVSCLVAFSIPVLQRYYFEPGLRPYPWREAARVVRREARRDDFFLFVNSASEISFSYYFPGARSSLVLTPVEAGPGPARPPALTSAQILRLASQHPRLWVIATPPFTPAMHARLLSSLGAAFRVAGGRVFPAIQIYLLEATSPSGRTAPGPARGTPGLSRVPGGD